MPAQNWIDLKQDAESGIETIRAHFEGHAYDPHWHDSYLVGVTEQGVQQFNCRGPGIKARRARCFCWNRATSTTVKRPPRTASLTACCTSTRNGWNGNWASCSKTPHSTAN